MWPWQDRTGQFSALRAAVFTLILLPGLWFAIQAVAGWLGPRPLTEAIHQSGLWAIRFLAVTLAITPLRSATRVSKLIGVRRMLGVSVFVYAALHLGLYVADQNFNLAHIASEIVRRLYLGIGFAAFVILCVLAATATDAMIKRLGSERWGRVHKWVYAVAALGTLHFFMQSKFDVSEALVMGGIFALLMADRGLRHFVRDPAAWTLAVLAAVVSLATALVEAAWYAAAKGASFLFILDSDLDFSYVVRPAWFVLLAGGVLVVARLLRPWFGNGRARTARPGVFDRRLLTE